jgi:hypothetical protein
MVSSFLLHCAKQSLEPHQRRCPFAWTRIVRTIRFASLEHLPRKMGRYASRKQFLVVTFADLQTAQRPQVPEMQPCENSPVARFAIRKDLREQAVHQGIKIERYHTAFLSYCKPNVPAPRRNVRSRSR